MSAKSVVNLTVHKNTLQKRQRREVYNQLREAVRDIPKDVDGFALVVYRDDGDESWELGRQYHRDARNTTTMAARASAIITRAVENS